MRPGVIFLSWLIYLAGFLGTYGHAFNTSSDTDPADKAIGAMLCSMAWPLYVSVNLWK